jgi:hypothetical protein
MAARISKAQLAALKKPAKKPAKKLPARRERDVLREVLAYLARAGIPAWRTNSGVFRSAGHVYQLAPAGTADVIGCLPPSGRMLAVEVKRPGGKLRPSQAEWLDRMRAAGALCFVATSDREVCEALRAEGYRVPDPL